MDSKGTSDAKAADASAAPQDHRQVELGEGEGNGIGEEDDGEGWSEVTGGRHKKPRQPVKPKFVLYLDQARRSRLLNRALVMATRPQAEPLFPGCSESESDDSDLEGGGGGEASARSPKFVLADVKCLLHYALITNSCTQLPRWCRLVKPNVVPRIVVVVVDSAGPEAAALLPKFLGHFYQAMRLLSPYACGDSVGRELFTLPLRGLVKAERDLLAARLAIKPQPGADASAAQAPGLGLEQPPLQQPVAFPERDKFPRTELLLSSVQLLHENYPIPGLRSGSSQSANYRNSLPAYQPATPSSPLYGIDCEMVVTEGGPGGAPLLELARATLIDEAGRVLMDRLVKPPNPVVNYLTAKSGITRELLDGATDTLEDVQNQLSGLLAPDAILIGHSLNCDLHALRMCHPNCIDTSVIYNLSGSRRHKAGLRTLAQRFLKRDIQSDDAAGHNSVEDALAALHLVQLKLSRSLEFGDAASGGWNSAASADDDEPSSLEGSADAPPSAKRSRVDSITPAATDGGDFHASLRGSAVASATIFDWLRMRGVSFRVFDRLPVSDSSDSSEAEGYGDLPPAYLRREAPDDAALVRAARSEVKCNRLMVLRLRCLETPPSDSASAHCPAQAREELAALDDLLDGLYEALPTSSLSIVLLPGDRSADRAAGSSARCYFNLKGMIKPQPFSQR